MAYKFIVILGIASLYVVQAECDTKVGGPSAGGPAAQQPADANVKALVEQLKPDIIAQIKTVSCESNVCLNADKLDATYVRKQVVSGTNYYVKVRAFEGEKSGYYHIIIFEQPWTNTLRLSRVEGPKEESTPL